VSSMFCETSEPCFFGNAGGVRKVRCSFSGWWVVSVAQAEIVGVSAGLDDGLACVSLWIAKTAMRRVCCDISIGAG